MWIQISNFIFRRIFRYYQGDKNFQKRHSSFNKGTILHCFHFVFFLISFFIFTQHRWEFPCDPTQFRTFSRLLFRFLSSPLFLSNVTVPRFYPRILDRFRNERLKKSENFTAKRAPYVSTLFKLVFRFIKDIYKYFHNKTVRLKQHHFRSIILLSSWYFFPQFLTEVSPLISIKKNYFVKYFILWYSMVSYILYHKKCISFWILKYLFWIIENHT